MNQQQMGIETLYINPSQVVGIAYSAIDAKNIGERAVLIMCVGNSFTVKLSKFEETELHAELCKGYFLTALGERTESEGKPKEFPHSV
jgi:hypothetical protein